MSDQKNPLAGTNASRAAETLKGVRAPELDVDWLGMDPTGAIAVFLGTEDTPVPARADPDGTSHALERIAASVRSRIVRTSNHEVAYRAPGSRTQAPVFDLLLDDYSEATLASALREHHERPFEGYPHLVFASHGQEPLVRALLAELGGREVLAADGRYAVSLEVVGPISYEELHMGGACHGCRVLDDPHDPRPRSAEALASAGLYVYGWVLGVGAATRPGWGRLASPTVPADRDDLHDVGLGALAQIPHVFETSRWLPS